MPESLQLLIGGEAGQGLVTLGQLLAKALVRAGHRIVVTQSYQSRIRGGHNSYAIRFGGEEVGGPCERVELLIALDEETVARHLPELAPGALVLLDEALAAPEGVRALRVPYARLAAEKHANTAALGVAGTLLGLPEELLAGAVEELFGAKGTDSAAENRRALAEACRWAAGQEGGVVPPPRPVQAPSRMLVNGNEAIALGALSAGLRFLAFYPMTPSTSIALTVTAHAAAMGVVAEQAEDEIAAINMAIGASFAGAPAMVCTSGGGFALMAEGVSLAGMTETPVVIVVGQRPGPATGLPTRTEQGDLDFVLHAGHGEFPRLIYAPGSIEECFHLARKAFFMAEMFQGPVCLLTDQFLADSYRAADPFDVEGLPQVTPGLAGEVAAPYERYALSPTGVSPRLLPGLRGDLVVADSDEHTPDGHLTEDLEVRRLMVEKRLKKGEGIAWETVPPQFAGDPAPELLFVCWGSTAGAVAEAVARARAAGVRAASLHFSQVWPLAPEQFLQRLRAAGRVVAVEGNAAGQFARLVRRETGFAIGEHVRRYDGLPISADYIARELKAPW